MATSKRALRNSLRKSVSDIIARAKPFRKPLVIIVAGHNGSGKSTMSAAQEPSLTYSCPRK